MTISRRSFIGAVLANAAAPAIVKAEIPMPRPRRLVLPGPERYLWGGALSHVYADPSVWITTSFLGIACAAYGETYFAPCKPITGSLDLLSNGNGNLFFSKEMRR